MLRTVIPGACAPDRAFPGPAKRNEGKGDFYREKSEQGFPVPSPGPLQARPEQVHEPLCPALKIKIAAESFQSGSLEILFQGRSLSVMHRVRVPAPPVYLLFLRGQQIVDRSADSCLLLGAHQTGSLIVELLRLAVSLFKDTCPDDQGIDRISQKSQGKR